jgi:putative hydrolase of the HAD superfamily
VTGAVIPQAILFDAGGTLVTIHPDKFREVVAPFIDTAPDPERMFDAHYLAMHSLLSNVEVVARPDWWSWWLATYLGFTGLGSNDEAAKALRDTRGLWQLAIPGVVEAVTAVKAVGYRIGVVSNADGHVARDLEAAGYGELFDVVIDSMEVGVSKPDPAIFTFALDALEVDPADAWYVGDSPLFDHDGADNAGIAEFVLVDPFGLYDHRPRVASVAELPGLLGIQTVRPPTSGRDGRRRRDRDASAS